MGDVVLLLRVWAMVVPLPAVLPLMPTRVVLVQVKVAPDISLLKDILVLVPLHMLLKSTLFTVGLGMTIMLTSELIPIHPLAVGLTVYRAVLLIMLLLVRA